MRRSPLRTIAAHRPARRYLAGALAMFAVAGQVASFAHLAVVRHAVCLEHGELVHADERGIAPLARKTENTGTSIQSREQRSDSHGHDHCGVAAHRRESLVLLAATAAAVTGCDAQAVTSLAGPSLSVVGRAIFHVAPKCSPPAQACALLG